MEYTDVVWLVAVTLTNLGYGEFTPSYWISRSIISCLSLGGLIQTALIVGVLSDTLLVGPDEKRIMASVEKTRANHLRRCAAAKLIQCAWRQYHFKCLLQIAEQKCDNTSGKKQRRLTLFKHLHRLRESHILERDFSDALWQWRQVKHSTNNVDNSLGNFTGPRSHIAQSAILRIMAARNTSKAINVLKRVNTNLRTTYRLDFYQGQA